jgi:hypothetical protein
VFEVEIHYHASRPKEPAMEVESGLNPKADGEVYQEFREVNDHEMVVQDLLGDCCVQMRNH